MKSVIYSGWVEHHRRVPREHRFRYKVDYLGLDLDELPQILRRHPWFAFRSPGLWRFHRRDYLGDPRLSLRAAVAVELRRAGIDDDGGPVQLISLLRSAGYCFNPVSFYCCRARDGALRAIIADITNTPWNERHAYVIPAGPDGASRDFAKDFHISPFMELAQEYRWRFQPGDGGLRVRMENHDHRGLVFTADLGLQARAMHRSALSRYALTAPLAPALTVARIYWQAFRLWRKGLPYVPHPEAPAGALPSGVPT